MGRIRSFPSPVCCGNASRVAWLTGKTSTTPRGSPRTQPSGLIGSEKIWDRDAALTSRLQTFETEMLAEEMNFAGLATLNRALIGKAETMESGYRTVLDMDSTEIPVYGEQQQSA